MPKLLSIKKRHHTKAHYNMSIALRLLTYKKVCHISLYSTFDNFQIKSIPIKRVGEIVTASQFILIIVFMQGGSGQLILQ